MTARRPIITVIGSGGERHERLATDVGRLLAGLGAHLLTGGGQGVMAAVSEAFAATLGRQGIVVRVLPCKEGDPCTPKDGYPNPWVEIPIRTHLPHSGERGTEPSSRNHINVLSSAAIVALPGGAGTASEAALALRYGRPIIAYLGPTGEIPRLDARVPVARSIDEVERFLEGVLAERQS